MISKTGQDKDLAELYSLLEGPSLLGFCKSALILESSLIPFEQLDKMRVEDYESPILND